MHQGAVRVHVHAGLTGVVLAGGRSSRFGRDKLAEPYRGAPLLHHALRRLAEVCDELVLVLPPEGPEPPLPPGLRVRVARDAVAHRGPLAGAQAGLAATRTELAVLTGGDMPEPHAAILVEMVRVLRETDADGVALRDAERVRPLPCLVRTEPARRAVEVLREGDRRRLRELLEALRVAVIDEPAWTALDPTRRTILDVDEPADLEALRDER